LFPGGIPAIPQSEFWEQKDYRQWSELECTKLLSDSPWAKMFGLNNLSPGFVVGYQVQLLSALPMRQAIVRQMQIAQNYEKLPIERRRKFDEGTEELLASSPDTVVVRVIGPNEANYWQNQTTDTMRHSAFLIPSKSRKIPLLKFEVMRSDPFTAEFEFTFPRHYEGQSILSAKDTAFSFEFAYPVWPAAVRKLERAFIEFKVNKMVINGNVVY
jgi:hypothetical protein